MVRVVLVLLAGLGATLGFVPARHSSRHGIVHLQSTATDSAVEVATARPVPKVPASAWKWPPVWPFPDDYLEAIVDESKYSSTAFSDLQISAFQNHIKFFVEPGSSVLEIGAQRVNLAAGGTVQHLALSDAAFGGKVTSKATPSVAVTSSGISAADNTYDAVVFSAGVEALSNPREVFRDVWRVLKPQGKCIICFAGKPNVPDLQPIKMWTTMTDEQKIWIAGSYYQYSAGEGWENIEG